MAIAWPEQATIIGCGKDNILNDNLEPFVTNSLADSGDAVITFKSNPAEKIPDLPVKITTLFSASAVSKQAFKPATTSCEMAFAFPLLIVIIA